MNTLGRARLYNGLILSGGFVLIALALCGASVRELLLETMSRVQTTYTTKGQDEYLWEDPRLQGPIWVAFIVAAILCFYVAALLHLSRQVRSAESKGKADEA